MENSQTAAHHAAKALLNRMRGAGAAVLRLQAAWRGVGAAVAGYLALLARTAPRQSITVIRLEKYRPKMTKGQIKPKADWGAIDSLTKKEKII